MDVKPRKLPRQARAKATVDAIIEATIQLLLKQGYDRFTTARVAERTGVSVGSLYQYFPNKAALAAAVVYRCCENFIVAFQTALASRPPRVTLAECVNAIVEMAFVSHHLAPDLHRIVLDLAPRLGVTEKTEGVGEAAAQLIEGMLRKHAGEIAPDIDLTAAATIIETLLEALAHRTVQAQPRHLENDLLAKETTRLITSYLTLGG